MIKKLVLLTVCVWATILPSLSHDQEIDAFTSLQVRSLAGVSKESFKDFFVECFTKGYEGLTLEQLGKADHPNLEHFLTKVAYEEWEKETNPTSPLEKTYRLLFFQDFQIVGYVSMVLEDDGNTVYLTQGCLAPDLWGKGAVSYVINTIIPTYALKAKRYNLLTRVLNTRAIKAYEKIGFQKDLSGELVKKHHYSVDHFIGMTKTRVLPLSE